MIYAVLGAYILAAFVSDARRSMIPNFLTAGACISGLLLHGAMSGWSGGVQSLIGLTAGFGMMLPLYWFRAIGAGDVKLFAGIGALAGSAYVINTMIYAVLFAGLIGLGLLIWRHELGRTILSLIRRFWCFLLLRDVRGLIDTKQSDPIVFPFMYAVAPAVLVSFTETVT